MLLPLHINSESLPYSTNPIRDGAGLFYNEIGKAKIATDHFTLLSFNDISLYEKNLNLVNDIFIKTTNYCLHPSRNGAADSAILCDNRLQILQGRINRLQEKFESINHLTGHHIEELRIRRGLFDVASKGFKLLFGVPDADDAKFYDQAITSILHQNHEIQILMKQQIHVISNAISEYNKTVLALKVNEEKFNKNFETFNIFANKTVTKVNSLSYYQTLNSHLNLLSFLINETDDDFSLLISTILFSKQNVLHPAIITPNHLQNELLQVKLSGITEFPFSIDSLEEMHKYTMITKLSVIYFQNNLIFAIKVPLVLKEMYQLFNLIPLPIQKGELPIYSYIDPSFPILTLSESRTYYSQMEDLASCISIPPGEYICQEIIVHLTKERPVCETELRLHPQLHSIPDDCQTRIIKSTMEIWHAIQPNQWLYILTYPTASTLNCGKSNIFDTVLQGTGIFTLQPGCRCYTPSTLLSATTNQSLNFTHFMPAVSINEDDCCKQKVASMNTPTMQPIQLHNLNLDELHHAQHKLEQYDQILQSNIENPFFNRNRPWYTMLLGIIISLIVLTIICLCCCFRCRPFLWMFDLIRSCFSKNACRWAVCINSHNTIQTSGDVRLSDLRRSTESFEEDPSRTPFLSTSRYSLPSDFEVHASPKLRDLRIAPPGSLKPKSRTQKTFRV